MKARFTAIFLLFFMVVPAFAQRRMPTSGTSWIPRWKQRMTRVMMNDFSQTTRYRLQNSQVTLPAASEDRVVFMGDSITDYWNFNKFFPGKPYFNRGIGGQVTPQMLVRFRYDVINLKPKVVVILGGTNDLMGVLQNLTLEDTQNNLASMADLARANGIRVVLVSILPTHTYTQAGRDNSESRPAEKIVALNRWLKDYCARTGDVYADYYSAVVDDKGMLRKDFSEDGLHLNDAGYHAVAPVAEAAIQKALQQASAAK